MKRTFIWSLAAFLLLITVSPFILADAEYDSPGYLHYVKLRQATSTSEDTLFGVDSLEVKVHFDEFQQLDWVHYVAPTFSGGDSAGLGTGILVFYSNDGQNYYAATVAGHDTIYAGATSATNSSTQLSSIPLLRSVKLRFVSTAANDSTIIGGYYIYR